MSLSIFCAAIAVASAGFIPPYYGGYDRHDDFYGKQGSAYGNRDLARGGYDRGYYGSEYDKADGDQAYYRNDYGHRGNADGRAAYEDAGAEGAGDQHHEAGARHNADAEGMKKFSYFSSGSGPQGAYSRGYYGSEGYDHEDGKSKYASDASGAGFKKGFGYDSKAHSDSAASYDKSTGDNSGFGKKHDAGTHGHEGGHFDKAGHADGWKNSAKSGARGETAPHGHY